MKHTLALCSIALCFALGCHGNQPKPTRTVALLDISGSIYPEEVDREFAEMKKLADSMHRGDELILIPITGNARNDTPGHILRLVAPHSRAPFDSDLVAFRKNADAEIAAMENWAKINPPLHTDILGSLAVAELEARNGTGFSTKLLILSDFLEDDGTWNFATNPDLTSLTAAERLGRAQAAHRQFHFNDVAISLGRLRSRDRAALSPSRLSAVDTFWQEFLQISRPIGTRTPSR